MRKPYFQPVPGGPPPLRMIVKRQVRFEEVDSMGIVWHGHYAGYLRMEGLLSGINMASATLILSAKENRFPYGK